MASDAEEQSRKIPFILSAAGFVVVVAGLKAASTILVPFLFAVLLTVVSAPMVFWLTNRGVHSVLAVTIVVLLLLGVVVAMGVFLGSSLNLFLNSLPFYQQRLQLEAQHFVDWLANKGLDLGEDFLLKQFNAGGAMSLLGNLLTSLGGLVSNGFLILLTTVFLLLEASHLPEKVRFGGRSPEKTLQSFGEFAQKVKDYAAIKTLISLGTGALVTIWVAFWGLDFPLLWGLLAFMMNYIPTFGSIFASVPAILIALVQYDLTTAAIVAAGYVFINFIIGSVLEPRFMGRGLGLSTLVVFLSLIVWAWIFGPVGMLLSVPLTITLKIALESSESTRWVAVLLGPAAMPPGDAGEEENSSDEGTS